MHSILVLSSLLHLSYTLPTINIDGLKAALVPRQQCPAPTYPGSFNPQSCPTDYSAGNSFDDFSLWKGHDKRSLSTPNPTPDQSAPLNSNLAPRQNPDFGTFCRLIAGRVFDHYATDNQRIANTPSFNARAGVRYVFSIATCGIIEQINVYVATGNNHFNRIAHDTLHDNRHSVTFGVDHDSWTHVEVRFGENIFQDGEVRLYEVGGNPNNGL